MTQAFQIGSQVRLISQPPYFKTAEPMPMLRPPDTIRVGEVGTIQGQRSSSYWVVHFSRGDFLLESQYLEESHSDAD
jgi:hypothetical protein